MIASPIIQALPPDMRPTPKKAEPSPMPGESFVEDGTAPKTAPPDDEGFDAFLEGEEPYSGTSEEVPASTDAPANDVGALAVAVTRTWFTVKPPPRRYLLTDNATTKGVLPRGCVGALLAEGGAGKTTAIIQLAIAVATGSAWLGAYQVSQPGRVLILLGEEDVEEAQRRIYYASQSVSAASVPDGQIIILPLAGEACAMLGRDECGNTAATEWLERFEAWHRENGPFDLILIDPLSRFAGPDAETDNAAGTKFVTTLEGFIKAHDQAPERKTTVLLAHHTRKTARGAGVSVGTADSRGASAITDGGRWVMTMRVDKVDSDDADIRAHLGEVIGVEVTKSNYAAKPKPLLLRRDIDNGGALVLLDKEDLAMLSEARNASDPRAQRKLERIQERNAQAEAKAAERARQDAEKARAIELRRRSEELTLVAILRRQPGIGSAALRAAMAADLGTCSREATDDALARLGSAVERVTGPKGARGHLLDETKLPTHLREAS